MTEEDTNTEKEQNEAPETRIYEVGYLLLPTVSEDEVATHVATIQTYIAKQGGAPFSEDFPTLQPLSYTMIKTVAERKQRFDKAYFGWIKFEMTPEGIIALKKVLDADAHVLRFMIMQTVRERFVPPKPTILRKPETTEKSIVRKDVPGVSEAEKPILSEEELDKTIEELVIE